MLPLVKHIIQTIIIDDSSQVKCEASCGVDWSSSQVIASVTQQIRDKYGDNIQLQYLDLSKIAANHDALEWNEVIKDKNLSLPLLLLDGKPRIMGEFDIRQLLDTIEAEIEIGA